MSTLKYLAQLVEWLLRYALLSPAQRRTIARRFSSRPGRPARGGVRAPPAGPRGPLQARVYWIGEIGPPVIVRGLPAGAVPQPAPDLMLVITGCTIFVTGCSLYFVSQGWPEALYDIPIFILSVLAALLHPRFNRRG